MTTAPRPVYRTVVHIPLEFTSPDAWPAEHHARFLADQIAFAAEKALSRHGAAGTPTCDPVTIRGATPCAVCGDPGAPVADGYALCDADDESHLSVRESLPNLRPLAQAPDRRGGEPVHAMHPADHTRPLCGATAGTVTTHGGQIITCEPCITTGTGGAR